MARSNVKKESTPSSDDRAKTKTSVSLSNVDVSNGQLVNRIAGIYRIEKYLQPDQIEPNIGERGRPTGGKMQTKLQRAALPL